MGGVIERLELTHTHTQQQVSVREMDRRIDLKEKGDR
jgi:hypothetical protein